MFYNTKLNLINKINDFNNVGSECRTVIGCPLTFCRSITITITFDNYGEYMLY